MDVSAALIVNTQSESGTKIAQKQREVLNQSGQEMILVPFGVTSLFITVDDNQLVVYSQRDDESLGCMDLDIAKGFDSVDECWDYASVVMKQSGLPEESCDADVWDALPDQAFRNFMRYQLARDPFDLEEDMIDEFIDLLADDQSFKVLLNVFIADYIADGIPNFN